VVDSCAHDESSGYNKMLGIFLNKSVFLLQIIRIVWVTAETVFGRKTFESFPFETRTKQWPYWTYLFLQNRAN
jgi:hypothetical protein